MENKHSKYIKYVDVRKTLTAVHCEATSKRSELLPNFYSANGERYGKKILFLSLRRSDGSAMATKKSGIFIGAQVGGLTIKTPPPQPSDPIEVTYELYLLDPPP